MAAEVSVQVVSPAGTTYADLVLPSDTSVDMLKAQLADMCQAPVDLLKLLLESVVMDGNSQLSTHAENGTRLNVTMIVIDVSYAFGMGSWQDVWVTGENPAVLQGEEVGSEIIVEQRVMRVNEAYDGPKVDGDGNVWLKWANSVTLERPVVMAFCLRMPDNHVHSCTMGLTTAGNLTALQGCYSPMGNISEIWVQPNLAYTPGYLLMDGEKVANFYDGEVRSGKKVVKGGSRFEHAETTSNMVLVLQLHRARQELVVACRGQMTHISIPADMWPDELEQLFPFVAMNSESFCGFENLEEKHLPLVIEALAEHEARRLAPEFFAQPVSCSKSRRIV